MNLLAQMYGGGTDLKSLIYNLILIIGCIVVLAIVVNVSGVKQYIPDWAFQILGIVCLIIVALWAIRTFF